MAKHKKQRSTASVATGDYEVGYGKPPKSGQFKPGQSGNLKGSRKKPESVAEQVRRILGKKVTVTEGGKQKRLTLQEIMLTSVANKAAKGDLKALSFIMDLTKSHEDQSTSTINPDQLESDSQALIDTFLRQQNIGEPISDEPADADPGIDGTDEENLS